MRRATRYKAVREQQLARAATAAGACFACIDGDAPRADWPARRGWTALLAPFLVLAPVMTSAAWYWRG